MSDIYSLVLNKPGYYQFTMPDGFEANVNVYTWGAGGGNGTGAPGGGGGYAASNVVIQTGNVVSIVVGTRGGDASGPYPGAAGTGASIGYNGGSGAYQGDPEDGDAGGSGGGGGATAVLVNGTAVAVAAGGGGGGGYGEDGAGGATAGYPGGIFVGQSTGYYQATHPRYCSFLNTYGVWGPFPTTVTINFPTTGTYTFNFSVDNYGSVVLDGTITLFSVTGELNYQSYITTTRTVSAGTHTITINPVNISGPASVGVQILNPSSVDIWNTLNLLVDTGLTGTTNGQNGTQGGAGGSGGGGGGLFGGETGVAYGDDGPGGQGGNGGQNYGDVTVAGTDQTSGGASLRTVFGLPPSISNAGYDGYAILSFTRKMRMFNKDSGTWKSVDKVYYKTPTAGVLSNVVTQTFSTVGDNLFNVPTGVNKLFATYPTATGMKQVAFPVTPGETTTIHLGDFGEDSSISGTAGTLTIPAYSNSVFRFRGNIDDLDDTNFSVATASGASFSGSGGQGTLTAGAAANGLYFVETNERYHGDLGATIDMTSVRTDTLVAPMQAYIASYSGRYGPPGYAYFLQQPTVDNSYVAVFRVYDPGSSEGYYDYTIGVQQQGWVQVTYDQAYAPGTWLPVTKVYYKDGFWKPLSSSNLISPTKLS